MLSITEAVPLAGVLSSWWLKVSQRSASSTKGVTAVPGVAVRAVMPACVALGASATGATVTFAAATAERPPESVARKLKLS